MKKVHIPVNTLQGLASLPDEATIPVSAEPSDWLPGNARSHSLRSDRYSETCNPTMFNCCSGYHAPDWSLFDGLEISACYDNGHGTSEPMVDEHEAAFFTVYGHFAPHTEVGGGVEALTDVSTRKLAQAIAERMISLASAQGVQFPHGISHF